MKTGTRYYDPTTGQYDRAAIMKDAWHGMLVRNNIHTRLSLRLAVIWAHAKAEKLDAEQSRQECEARHLRIAARVIEHKTTMTASDYAKVQHLRTAADELLEAA